MSDDSRTLMLVSAGGRTTRSVRLSRTRIRLVKIGLSVFGVAVLLLGVSWVFLFQAAGEREELRERVMVLEGENLRVESLANQLQELEVRYTNLLGFLSVDEGDEPPQLWLPPPGGRPEPQADGGMAGDIPASWPLAAGGFVTRAMLEGPAEDHAGVDIAVPTGTYVRAAADGIVLEAGEDSVYGLYARIEHVGGYSTLYAHASELFVASGAVVRRDEVIALSGSTGRSTAPHLHFEVRLNGETLDPMTMVAPPS